MPRELLPWPRRFLRFLAATGATQVDGAPSIWRSALQHEPELLASLELRGMLYTGEEFPLHELRALQRAHPDARVVNCYGSTESVACSFTDVPNPLPEDATGVSIGTAHPGAEMVLVDEHGEVATGPGATGEIHLHSPALFSGYWNDPEGTRAALVPDPACPESGQIVFRTRDLATRGPDGALYYRGRTDSQVKVRGNRVDLREIDRQLMNAPRVALARTLLVESGEGEPVLTAFVTPEESGPEESGPEKFDRKELRKLCARALPDYMVPERIHVRAAMPLNSNGKIDAKALRRSVTAPGAEADGGRSA